jgi:hypothetical protein
MHTCRFLVATLLLATVAFAGSVGPAWIQHYTGPTQSQENEAADSYIDTLTGNLYVVGSGELSSNPDGTDLVVMKYRPDGTRAWVNGFSGTGSSSDDMAQAIAVDSVGNVYIAGMTDNDGPQYTDAAWAKYDSSGNEIWHRTSAWNGYDVAFDIAIGRAGDVYICGSDSGYDPLTGYMVARIDPSDGDTLWRRSFVLDTEALARRKLGKDVHPDYFEDYSYWDNSAVAIAPLPDSGVVTTGHGSDFDRMFEWWTMRFTPSGNRSWAVTYRNPLSTYDDDDVAFDIAAANNGDIYVVGFDYYETGSTSQGYNYAIVRYSSSGSRLNYRSLDVASEHGDDYAFSVALDDSSSQNVYVTGTLAYPYPLNEQISTMKLNNALTSRWGAAGATYGSDDDDRGYSVCYRRGRTYVTGRTGDDLFVLGYTAANGSPKDTLWTYLYDDADQMIDLGATICASDSDHVFVSGEASHAGTPAWTSLYTARLRYGHPEMAVTAINAPQGTYDHYDTVTPRATITNNGSIIPMTNAFMYIGLPYGDTIRVFDGPAPGQSATISFRPWAAHPTGLVQVRCSIEVEGDTVPSNDFHTDTVRVIPIDVGCRSIVAPVGTIDSGTNVVPVARFKNFGTTTKTFPVWFRIETAARAATGASGSAVRKAARSLSLTAPSHPAMAGPLLQVYEDSDTITLAPQESANVSFDSWLASPQDTYLMKAFSAILDDGPTNDTVRAQLIVRRPRHDVGVSAILAPADTVDSGAVIAPRAVITNFGGARDSFRIRFTIGSFYASETVMVLPVGSSDTAEFAQWTANQVGTHTARCSTRLAGDSTPANDFAQRQIVVRPAPGIESPENLSGIPREYSLGSPRPNPFVGRLLMPFALPARSQVSLRVYDAAGALVRTLTAAELPAGFHHAQWSGTDERGQRVQSGTYFCRMQAPSYSRIVKLIVSN